MAPEEFRLGAPIDQRTTVFTLGRLVWHFATGVTERAEQFCGSPALQNVVQRATAVAPEERFAGVQALAVAWRAACQQSGVPLKRSIGPLLDTNEN
jgi:serine/threonine-protein kinase